MSKWTIEFESKFRIDKTRCIRILISRNLAILPIFLLPFQVDPKLNDAYFRREKAAKSKPEASFFADPKNKQAHPESKVADQKALDKSVIAAIKKEGPTMAKYLAATFSLSHGERPHAMVF